MENENAAIWFVDRHLEEGRGAKQAFREADGAKRTLTYGQLSEETARFAGALARHGVRREERVAMIERDQLEFPVVLWGALKAGAIPVPLNTLLAAQVYEAILNIARKTGADLIVVAAHRPELKDYLLGPNAARVVRHANCSVLVVRP